MKIFFMIKNLNAVPVELMAGLNSVIGNNRIGRSISMDMLSMFGNTCF